MQFIPKSIKKFLQGGEMAPAEPAAAPEAAPEQGGEQDPIMMLAEAATLALQAQDCLMAMQVCEGLISLLQQMAGGTPQEAQGEPVFKKGGKLVRRIKK